MRSRQVKSRLIKLDAAAKRLGCHIETLRLRIRTGRLKAVRGPHGAYFISARSLRGLRVRKPAPWKRRRPTAEEREAAWETAVKRLRRQPRAFDEFLPFHQGAEDEALAEPARLSPALCPWSPRTWLRRRAHRRGAGRVHASCPAVVKKGPRRPDRWCCTSLGAN